MKYGSKLYEPRVGCLLHYDASTNDKGAVAWFSDPRCKVSYQWLVTDDGVPHRLAPDTARAYHAGVCRPSNPRLQYKDANSAFYGISLAATDGDTCTPQALQTVVRLCVGYFLERGWKSSEVFRIVGHSSEASPRGRKVDPEGTHPTPVLSVDKVREAVKSTLEGIS